MKISVVTINFNDSKGLTKTLESVAMQVVPDSVELEHIIIDGGSTDGSVDVIRDYEKQLSLSLRLSLKWVSERDKGIYDGMDKGIRMATGDYIVILNSADCLAAPDVIARMVQALDDETDILLGNIVNVYPGKKSTAPRKSLPTNPQPIVVSPTLLHFYHGTIPHDAALIRKSIYATYGYYDINMKICSDWKLFLQAMVLGANGVAPLAEGRVKHVDVDMVLFDMTGTSNQNTDKWQAEKRPVLEAMVPATILRDYDAYYNDICLMQRIHRHPLAFYLVRFIERVLFKLEKWFKR